MKRIVFAILLLLLIWAPAQADTYLSGKDGDIVASQITTSADSSGNSLEGLSGTYLYDVEIKTTLDSAITFSIYSRLGTLLYTVTTTTATVGERHIVDTFYALPLSSLFGNPTYTVSGLGSGNAIITVIGVK